MFEKTLNELIRGIRSHPDIEAKYISQCMDECRKELKSGNVDVKANAVSKLNYMHMMGYNIDWASFNVVEVMSSKKFSHKRIGYLTAAQSFTPETDVLMLTTNMVKKDIGDQNQYVIGVALNGLSEFMSPDLARDLASDIVTLTASSRPYVRKKATLILYKVFLRYPDALRPAFPRLKEKLDDEEASTQSCAVNVICELARKNPRNYLSLAPIFFRLLTNSQNNWMRIKIIKLFAALTPLEPRLAKKLIDPLTNLIHQTPAMSLLYECISTVIVSVPEHLPSIQLCVTKLRIFIEDQDQNLKYLGLQAMADILKIHPKVVAVHRDLIISCLEDGDESIRLRALALIGGMCTKKNLVDIVRKLLKHLEVVDGHTYRDEVVAKIIEICYQGNYQYVTDFGWYLSVLIQLTHMEGTKHGKLIASQLMDVTIRVKVVRPVAAKQMAALLTSSHLLNSKIEKNGVCEVLYASAYVVGEFAEELDEPLKLLDSLLQPTIANLPGHIQAVCIHNVTKIYGKVGKTIAEDDEAGQESLAEVRKRAIERLGVFAASTDLEVQERAVGAQSLLKYVQKQREKGVWIDDQVAQLYDGDLNPVAPRAQKKVPLPEGLDLDKRINKQKKIKEVDDTSDMFSWMKTVQVDDSMFDSTTSRVPDLTDEELEQRRKARDEENKANVFHLGGGMVARPEKQFENGEGAAAGMDIDNIPMEKLDLDVGSIVVGPELTGGLSKKEMKKRKKELKRLKKEGLPIPAEYAEPVKPVVATVFDMPEGAELEEGDNQTEFEKDDPHKALGQIDLSAPLEGELFQKPQHHVAKSMTAKEAEELEREKAKAAKKAAKKAKKAKKEKKKTAKEGGGEESADSGGAGAAEPAVTLEQVQAEEGPLGEAGDLASFLDDKPKETSSGKKKKKDKKDKKKKKAKEERQDFQQLLSPTISGRASPVAVFTTSEYRPLETEVDKGIKIMYDTCVGPETGHAVTVSFMMLNTKEKASGLNVTFGDTAGVEVTGLVDNVLPIPFELAAGASQDFRFELKPSSPKSVTLTGEIKYKAGADGADDVSQSFTLPLPTSTFTYPNVANDAGFAELLAGGSLEAKHSISCPRATATFEVVLRYVAAFLHLTVIERSPGAASLHGKSTTGEHLCFLLKCGDDDEAFSLDGKSETEDHLVAIMDELASAWTDASQAAASASASASASPLATAESASGGAEPAAEAEAEAEADAPAADAKPAEEEAAAPTEEASGDAPADDDDDEFKEADGGDGQ
eukprot:m.58366 g.58366  ORF g.58366 m.58366 type:complete len:1253 (+) comp7821_c0_seq1:94-3852(+)